MKRVFAVLLAVSMLFMLCSCKNNAPAEECAIVASYSVKSTGKDFVVEVQNLGGVYEELYDRNGLYIKFRDGEKIFDKDGNPISREDLSFGDTLRINYDGKLAKNNPKTIKAISVEKIY